MELETKISVTAGSPRVNVPVLSSTTVSILPASSNASASRMIIPFSAALPVPTIIAVGVARPSAHGQATTSTATAFIRANSKAGSGPQKNQSKNEIIEMAKTTGTKYPVTVSAYFWIGALDDCASSTNFMTVARKVSEPTLVARNLKAPVLLMVAPTTASPTFLSTGMDSPVTMDSSRAEYPSMIIPSTGTFSPGLTSRISPTLTSSIGTSISCFPS